jgi:hypothetical protein
MKVLSNAARGYRLQAASDPADLTAINSIHTIPMTDGSKDATGGSNTSLDPGNLAANTWGIAVSALQSGAVSANPAFDGKWLSLSDRAEDIASVAHATSDVKGDYYNIGYGVKIDGATPAGTYATNVTYTLAANV